MNEKTSAALDAIFSAAPIQAAPITQDLTTVDVVTGELMPVTDEMTPEEIAAKQDFEFSRGAVKMMAVEGQNTTARAVEVAIQTDQPRAFEVVADLMRATLEAHRDLQLLHKTAAEIRLTTQTTKNPPGSVNIDKGVVFTGTSEDLLRLLSKDRQ